MKNLICTSIILLFLSCHTPSSLSKSSHSNQPRPNPGIIVLSKKFKPHIDSIKKLQNYNQLLSDLDFGLFIDTTNRQFDNNKQLPVDPRTVTKFRNAYNTPTNGTHAKLQSINNSVYNHIWISKNYLKHLMALTPDASWVVINLVQVSPASADNSPNNHLSNHRNNLYLYFNTCNNAGQIMLKDGSNNPIAYDLNSDLTTIEMISNQIYTRDIANFENTNNITSLKRGLDNVNGLGLNGNTKRLYCSYGEMMKYLSDIELANNNFSKIKLEFTQIDLSNPNYINDHIVLNRLNGNNNRFSLFWHPYNANGPIPDVPVYDFNDLCPNHCFN